MTGAFQSSAFQDSAFQVSASLAPAAVTNNFAGPPWKQRRLYRVEGRTYWLTPDELRYLLQQVLARAQRPGRVARAIKAAPEIVEEAKADGPGLFMGQPQRQLERARRIEQEIAPQDERAAQFLAALIEQLELRADIERDDEEVLLLIA